MIVWKGIYVNHEYAHEMDAALDRLAVENPNWTIDRDVDWEFDPDANATMDEPESQASKHADEGYMNDTRFGPPED